MVKKEKHSCHIRVLPLRKELLNNSDILPHQLFPELPGKQEPIQLGHCLHLECEHKPVKVCQSTLPAYTSSLLTSLPQFRLPVFLLSLSTFQMVTI
jgi:hypothetical protein